jgi:hypothetical protein
VITELVLAVGVGFVRTLFGLLPVWTMPTLPNGSLASTLGSTIGYANGWAPVVTLFGCVGIVLAYWLAVTLWGVLVFIYDRLPFKAT